MRIIDGWNVFTTLTKFSEPVLYCLPHPSGRILYIHSFTIFGFLSDIVDAQSVVSNFK
jgi:hypothetical protein